VLVEPNTKGQTKDCKQIAERTRSEQRGEKKGKQKRKKEPSVHREVNNEANHSKEKDLIQSRSFCIVYACFVDAIAEEDDVSFCG